MSSAKEVREARRRKILERGGDRLAYITGQVKALPPQSQFPALDQQPQLSIASPPGESGLKSLSIAHDTRPSQDDALPTSSASCDVNDISEQQPRQPLNAASEEETTLLLPPSASPAPAPVPATPPAPSTSQQQQGVARVSKPRVSVINFGALVKSIERSVWVRGLLSVLIGVLLVTQWTFSKCGRSPSFALGWPVLLVVISDVTVVLLGLVNASSPAPAASSSKESGLAVFRDARVEQMLAFTSQLEGALDFGLLLTKASRGLAADISLYLVTVICTVSIAQHHEHALCSYISR